MTIHDLEREKPVKITVAQASEVMGCTPQFLRAALLQNKFPFGVGVEMEQNEFWINTHRFWLYMIGADLARKRNLVMNTMAVSDKEILEGVWYIE